MKRYVFSMILVFLVLSLVGCASQASSSTPVVMPTPKNLAFLENHLWILVAAKDINTGEAISSGIVSRCPWPIDIVPEGSSTVYEDIDGRIALIVIPQGTPILSNQLSQETAPSTKLSDTSPMLLGSSCPSTDKRVDVLIAQDNLLAGKPISMAQVAVISWPDGAAPEDAVSRVEELDGKLPSRVIVKNSLILLRHLK